MTSFEFRLAEEMGVSIIGCVSYVGMGDLCFAHVDEDDISSHKLELLVGKFVRGLKYEGNTFYKNSNMGLALAKYSLTLKILSFVMVFNDEDKSVFSSLVVSLNINLGAYYVKEKNFDKMGQLCSEVLCYDTSNVKAYFRRAVAALELNKLDLAFMDLVQAIRIDPNNRSRVSTKTQGGDVFIVLVSNLCIKVSTI
ncbi:peptidyl-prolyl cis-trans isomerase FKBP62-like [Chenopodium quinoa]|uniref:peptidyl-prolyl cis-trans isomerase FKBP62-like n=1 Tax=Chenopodium quinoa TaxID=63459 RepID=UPI000B78631D|nr:peptidyl-prolyl cis-trans isomerase FKBP62-like [Chenopodium quinoa]